MAEAMEIDDNFADENANKKILADPMATPSFLSPKKQKRLDYLLEQAELFSHFVDNSPKQTAKRKMAHKRQKKSSNRRHDRSIDEEEGNVDEKATGVRFEATPAYVEGTMRDYQLRGLNWLISLYENNVNGILADEMGLGKTLQTISILGFLKNYKSIDGPFLVVGPKSTLQNWFNEVNRFCPSLRPLTLIGQKTSRQSIIQQLEDLKSWDVLLTTFEMILMERNALKRYNWHYLVVDEAHRLKNENSQLSTILRSFKSSNRLLLTGTPLQNNLHELWALLNFLLPDVFASANDFDTWFDSDDCLRGNHDIVQRLRTILKPFMLRRIKSEVEKSLLPKIELKLFISLTPLQHETYKAVLLKEIKKINAFGEQSTKPINMIVQELRKAANHPYLIENIEPTPYTTDLHLITSCGKMMVLDKLLEKLKSQDSRVVMFSQLTMMLDILEDYLNWRGYKYRRLDGQTLYEERAKSIDEFNAENSDIFVFIISTRAGGLGINLTTADTVIIYDSDWNPQIDLQAIDRVHRIGQKKQVRVFRLITENTIDERIVQRAEIKHRLDRMVIQNGKGADKNLTEMTKEMKRDMVHFGADYILSGDGCDLIDVDIDKILKAGELKTAQENEKYSNLSKNELRNLTLEEASSVSVYQFEGVDFRSMQNKTKGDESYLLRRRKSISYAMPTSSPSPSEPKIMRKMHYLQDYQFHSKDLLHMSEDGWVNMNEDKEEKQQLLAKGFTNWKRHDFKMFIDAMHKFGRYNLEAIAATIPGKTLNEVTEYHRVFWSRGQDELREFDRYISSISKAETERNRLKTMSEAFRWKMSKYRCPEMELTLNKIRYNRTQYTLEKDRFILSYLFKFEADEPNVYSRIRQTILSSKKHNFDFYLRSRTAAELQKRATTLLMEINREYLENMAKNTSASSDISASTNGDTVRMSQDKMEMDMDMTIV